MQEATSSVAHIHARKALEDQIEVHAQAIIDIKTRLNTMTTVARLPPEILSTILTLVAAENFEQKYRAPGYVESYYRSHSWITVAHVCRHWRNTALSSPRFWSYIIVTGKRAVDEMLLRSKKAPLHIVASVPSYEDDRQRAVKGVMAEFARIRALQLAGSSQAICDLFKMITAPAAMLESIKLSDRPSYYYGSDSGTMPLMLPADGVPRLRNLEINGFSFAWDHPLFCPTLTTLLLHGRAVDARPHKGSFETFLSALERMTDLKELELEYVVPEAPSGPPSRKVPLMHLSSLRLVAGDAECRSVLNHLTLPSNVRYHISVIRGPLGPANLFLALQKHLSSSSPIRTACFDDTRPGRLSLEGWRAELQQVPLYRDEQSPDLTVEVVTGHSVPALLRASTVYTGVTHLDIRLDGHVHQWRWMDVFAGMPHIRRLSVSRDQDLEFLDALCHTNDDDPATLALPHLEVLKLSDMRLASRDYDEPHEFLDVLVDALIKRCNCGFPLQVLHIEECFNAYHEEVDQLADIVPEFYWDGVEQEDEDEDEEEPEDEDYDSYGYGYDYDEDDYEVDEDDLMVDGGFFGLY